MAFRAQQPDVNVKPAMPGVMAVKEFYDDANNVVGSSVIYYPDGTLAYYYCYGPAERCYGGSPETTMDAPIWGDENASEVSNCRICHGGKIFTELP